MVLVYVIDDWSADYSLAAKVFLMVFCYLKAMGIILCTSSFAYVLARYSKDQRTNVRRILDEGKAEAMQDLQT